MKQIWQLARREIVERKLLFPVALALGVLAPVVALLAGYEVAIVSLVLAIGLGHAVALLVGATTVNRPLREGRLGFFFNRPVGEGAVWWGKLLGTLLLALSVELIVFAPGYLWALLQGADLDDAVPILWASACGLLGSVLVGHVFGTMVGSRSKTSLVDFAALVVSAGLVWWSMERLWRALVESAVIWLAVALTLAGLVGALVGGWRQVRLGRVDPQRSHRALSAAVWGATLSAAVLGWGFTSWVLSVDPTEMSVVRVDSGSDTPWFSARHLFYGRDLDVKNRLAAQILTNAETGEWHTLHTGPAGHLPARLSRDASVVIWTTFERGREPQHRGWIASRTDRGLVDRRELPPIVGVENLHAWQLSPSGDRIADVHYREDPSRPSELNARVRVWDVRTGRPQMEEWLTLPLARAGWRPHQRLFWDDDGAIRLFVDDNSDLVLWTVRPERGSIDELARLPIGDEDSPRFVTRSGQGWTGGVAVVRFGPRGQTVLVGRPVLDESSEGEQEPAIQALTQSESESETETESSPQGAYPGGRMGITLYTGDLSRALWTLDPLEENLIGIELVEGRAHASLFGRGEGISLRIGGPEGWGERYPKVWSLGTTAGDGSVLLMKTDGKVARLDLESGDILPLTGLDESSFTYRALSYEGIFRGLIGLHGSELWHDSTRDLLAVLPDLGTDDSIVRADFDRGELVPLYD